jgi:hypothetical protein
MDYAASNPLSIIRYTASGMTLYVHSDASYLSEIGAHSRASGHFSLSSPPLDPDKPPAELPTLNGPIHTLCKIIDVVVGSAAEAEIGAGYLNAQAAVPICETPQELGHPQPLTPMQVGNTTAEGFANGTMKQKRSKAMDMQWHWLKDWTRQGQFLVYYRPGKDNLADPFTKHHPAAHLEAVTPNFLRCTEHLVQVAIHHLVRGCVSWAGARRHVCLHTSAKLAPHKVVKTTNSKIVPAPNKRRSRVAH